MPAYIEKIASTTLSKILAQFLVPHKHNNHHPLLIRHESLFIVTLIILVLQFFSFAGISGNSVLGFATDITRASIINLTNQERSSRGIAPLKESNLLDQSATLKGQDMFAKNYWAHFAPDGTSPWYFFKQVGYQYTWAGENLARDFQTSGGVVAGWMASQGHRDNMLNPNFTEIGISVSNGTLEGEQTTLVVEHLGQVLGSSANNSSGTNKSNNSGTAASPLTVEDTLKSPEKKENQATATANVNQVNEKISGKVESSFSFNTFWQSLNLGQRTTISLLAVLLVLFAFDSFVILRRGVHRHNSHSLLHAGVLAILIITLVRSAAGGIL